MHDAFLVRYEAGAQALLPMHSDESEVSLTIALNPLGEYDGGGTVIAPLQERDLLERDFGDDWVNDFEDAVEKMIQGAVQG